MLAIPPTVPSMAAAALCLAAGSRSLPDAHGPAGGPHAEAERGLAIGTLSASFDVGIVVGSLAIGFMVEQTSYGMGFVVAGAGAILGLATFVMTERSHGRLRVVPRPPAGV